MSAPSTTGTTSEEVDFSPDDLRSAQRIARNPVSRSSLTRRISRGNRVGLQQHVCAAQESDGNARIFAWDGMSGIAERVKWSGVESHREGWPQWISPMDRHEKSLSAAPRAQAARRRSERAGAMASMPRKRDAIVTKIWLPGGGWALGGIY